MLEKNDLKLIKIGYFCILDFLVVFQMLNNNKIFSIKDIYK